MYLKSNLLVCDIRFLNEILFGYFRLNFSSYHALTMVNFYFDKISPQGAEHFVDVR
jgi:hypothetical protein